MRFWRKAVGYGLLVWLVPFVVAVAIFPIHVPNRALFESIMAIAVTGTAVGFGLLYLRAVTHAQIGEGLRIGLLWLVISVLVDTPLMLLGGPMKMTVFEYASDIGITYLCIPIVTLGLGFARSAASSAEPGTTARDPRR